MPKRSSGQFNQTERHVRSRSPYEVEKRRSATLSGNIIHDQASKDGLLSSQENRLPVSEDTPERPRSSLPSANSRNIDKRTSFEKHKWQQWHPKSPWACSVPLLAATAVASILMLIIIHAFVTRQLDPKGCGMCWSRPLYVHFKDFDTEHTRFASKYSLYMIKEGGIDEDSQVKGVPILFIPGNAGSYKQARCLEFESAHYFHTIVQQDPELMNTGAASLDFFTLDFNEDFSAFHGQTLLDQAEYVNDAIAYILSLYHDPRRAQRDPTLPDPSSVILIGHSMGGLVARAMVTMPNFQSNSINTIITMSTPHARAPVSVDVDLVRAYERVNDYWRRAHLEKWANDNPLWHITLISIAGGGLDTIVPSDYASLESLVPLTHGFTVFTSGIPNVWTGSDHIQTTWCVQLIRAIMRSTYEILDVHRSGQTKARSERMRILKRWYLSGMEDAIEKSLPEQEASTLIPLDKESNTVLTPGERLILRELGHETHSKAYLFQIKNSQIGNLQFSLLTDQSLQADGTPLEVLFCTTFETQAGQSASLLSMNIDLSSDMQGSSRLACKNGRVDAITLPASTRNSKYPFDDAVPFNYMSYGPSDLHGYQYVAVLDRATEPRKGWVLAELGDSSSSILVAKQGLQELLSSGVSIKLPAKRGIANDIEVPALHSSLLAFSLHIGPQICGDDAELFTPLLRQHIEEPFESKFVVNAKSANVSLHGIAPFMPPPLRRTARQGVALQLWSDPTCDSSIDISLKVDIMGSMGKLVMRYRLVFAAFPLLVVALVLRKQFMIYDESGMFITFMEAANLCSRTSLPLLFLGLSILAASLALSNAPLQAADIFGPQSNATESAIDFTRNDLLLGSQDPIFWFLVPLFGLISLGACILINYAALCITHIFYTFYDVVRARPSWAKMEELSGRSIAPGFSPSSPRRRLITTCILLFLVSTVIPYQFAFLDAVLVQLMTCVRALRLLKSTNSSIHHNFYNYTHSILILMLWILPINLPVLLVWVHNLAIHWLTPFSSHHNIISIMPYLMLVETLTSGRMIPRLHPNNPFRHLTNVAFFALACYAAIYGVSFAYMLHHFVNGVCAWLVGVHVFGGEGVDLKRVKGMLDGNGDADEESVVKKQP